MKTPTLIVRLVGLSLLLQGSVSLVQLSLVGGMRGGMIGTMWIIAILGFVVGLIATIFAGRLARLLTFDAGPE